MTLEEFKKELECHDWFSYMSDDHSVWANGEVESARMKKLAVEGDDDFKRAYNHAYAQRFHTESFSKPYTWPFPEVMT